jgi:hypothetical protein
MKTTGLVLLTTCTLLAFAPDATAQPALASEGPPAASVTPARLHVDAEVDPTAYVLSGYSLHLGLGWRRVRLDLGAFAMALPGFAVSNDAFDVSFHGFGAKLQVFPFAEQRGGFVGIDSALAWQLAQRSEGDLAATTRQVTLGVNVGWRFMLGEHLYVTPWVGVSRAFGARDVTLAGSTYQPQKVLVFPAIHVGYKFD